MAGSATGETEVLTTMVVVRLSNNHQISRVNSKTSLIFSFPRRKVFRKGNVLVYRELLPVRHWSGPEGPWSWKQTLQHVGRGGMRLAIRIETSANIGAWTLECCQPVIDTPKSSKNFPGTSGSGNTWIDRQRKSDSIGWKRPQ